MNFDSISNNFADKLRDALEYNDNKYLSIVGTNIQKIKSEKNDALQRIGLKKENLKEYNQKLKGYRYIEEIKDLRYGSAIRWINLEKDEIRLNNVAFLCDIKILDNGLSLQVRTYNNKYITLYFNKNLIFQKLNDEEKIILKANELLRKKMY